MTGEILDSTQLGPDEKQYAYASTGKRVANYFIDVIGYYALAFIVGIVLAITSETTGAEFSVLQEDPALSNPIADLLFGLAILMTYYIGNEYFLKGKSLGKLITGTRAVNKDNSQMDLGTIVKRSLCRLVPFEAFSFLGSEGSEGKGWHDSWSDTKVILDKGWQPNSEL